MTEKEKCTPGGAHEEGCGCGCGAEEEPDFITLEFDDGQEVECEVMGVFDFDGKEYIALIPDDGTDDVYIYGYKEVGDDEFELLDIDDDAEFEKVVKEFESLTDEDAVED